MKIEIQEEQGFKFVEAGEGNDEVLLLLHGLFGALSNFQGVIDHFSKDYKVSIPLLPLYTLEPKETTVTGLLDYVTRFVEYRGYKTVVPIGNSLGGHIGLLYALANTPKIKAMVLTGSSGLFESALGDSYPRKSDYDFIKNKTELTFYDPKVATKELVDEVYEIVNNREKALRILYLAKSALRHNLRDKLQDLDFPVLLLWGKNDTITPPEAAEGFHRLLPNSTLQWIDKCGHAAMMEHPEEFNRHVERFLQDLRQKAQ